MEKILTKEQRAVTKQQIKEEVMRRCIEEFRASGDADIAARKLSMAYLLMTMGNHYAEESVELMYKRLYYEETSKVGKIQKRLDTIRNIIEL